MFAAAAAPPTIKCDVNFTKVIALFCCRSFNHITLVWCKDVGLQFTWKFSLSFALMAPVCGVSSDKFVH